jgi:ABC-type transport system involved in multi-copper enzyme maturation permease subunit
VNALQQLLFFNPELIRNVRAQLRMKRLAIAAIVSGVISLVIIPAIVPRSTDVRATNREWAYTRWVLAVQAIVLIIGGGIACLQAIGREKEQNTFDYQRITRLSPFELTLGKLFGAPVLAWFVALCFVPAALAGVQSSNMSLADLLSAWILLLCAALGFHAFALLLSMLLSRALSTGAVLLFLFFSIFSIVPGITFIVSTGQQQYGSVRELEFYGNLIPYTPFFSVVYLSLAAWFLLALARNIKRDPTDYELYKPVQALIFAAYLIFLLMGVIPSATATPVTVQSQILWTSQGIFFALGLVLLRNRHRARRRLRQLGERGDSWFEAVWPAPYLLLAVLITGLLPFVLFANSTNHRIPWDPALYTFRWVFFALWICRDVLFLQWMDVRPGRRPLMRAILYQFVYYAATLALFFTSSRPVVPSEAAFQSIFTPARVWTMDTGTWNEASGIWLIALLCQAGAFLLFAFLHRQALRSLAVTRKASPPSISSPAPAVAR